MNVEKRRMGKSIKYYLSYSFREGEKVHKIRKYLGKDLNEKLLKERIRKAEKLILDEINEYKLIQDPLQVELDEKEMKFVRELEVKNKLKIFHLSEKQWRAFSELFTYNTNAIEGSELERKEVKQILKK